MAPEKQEVYLRRLGPRFRIPSERFVENDPASSRTTLAYTAAALSFYPLRHHYIILYYSVAKTYSRCRIWIAGYRTRIPISIIFFDCCIVRKKIASQENIIL